MVGSGTCESCLLNGYCTAQKEHPEDHGSGSAHCDGRIPGAPQMPPHVALEDAQPADPDQPYPKPWVTSEGELASEEDLNLAQRDMDSIFTPSEIDSNGIRREGRVQAGGVFTHADDIQMAEVRKNTENQFEQLRVLLERRLERLERVEEELKLLDAMEALKGKKAG